MLFRALQTSVRTRIHRSVSVLPPPSGAGVRSGYLEPPLPGAGSSVWVCRASLTRGRFIIPVLCGRPFPSDCGVEGEAGGIASRTGRRLRSVLPHIPGGVLRGGYGKSVRKSRPREVIGMERGGKGDGRGMKAQNSAAARLAERGVAGRMPFSRITIGCFETLTRHPAATAFGGTSHPVSLRDMHGHGRPATTGRSASCRNGAATFPPPAFSYDISYRLWVRCAYAVILSGVLRISRPVCSARHPFGRKSLAS